MGRTASLDGSFSTTIGMLVTGSIINPRIFISTSIWDLRRASPLLQYQTSANSTSANRLVHHHLAYETVWEALCYKHPGVTSSRGKYGRIRREIHGFILRAAADDLSASLISSFNHYFQNSPDVLLVINPLNLSLSLLKNAQTLRFFLVGDAV